MKRIIALLLATVCVVCCFGACGDIDEGKSIQVGVEGTKEKAIEIGVGKWSENNTVCTITDAGIVFDMTEFATNWSAVEVNPEDNKGKTEVLMKAGKKTVVDGDDPVVYNNVMVVANEVVNATPEKFLGDLIAKDEYKDDGLIIKDAEGAFADLNAKYVVLNGRISGADADGNQKGYKQKIIAYQTEGKENVVFAVIITATEDDTIMMIENKFKKEEKSKSDVNNNEEEESDESKSDESKQEEKKQEKQNEEVDSDSKGKDNNEGLKNSKHEKNSFDN